MGMTIVKMDERGRILLPYEVRKSIRIHSDERLNLILEDDAIILKKIKNSKKSGKKDSLTTFLENPSHVDPKKLKKIDLEKIENEMWLP